MNRPDYTRIFDYTDSIDQRQMLKDWNTHFKNLSNGYDVVIFVPMSGKGWSYEVLKGSGKMYYKRMKTVKTETVCTKK